MARGRPTQSEDSADEEESGSETDALPDAPETVQPELVESTVDPVVDDATTLTPFRDPVQRFLREVRRYPRLSEDEEKDLIRAVRDRGDREAARTLVVHNLRLVVSISYQYRQAWINMLDLFQEGSIGLMEAVKRWEPSLGTRFGSYAAYWIRAYILRYLMTNARLIHVGNTRAGRKLFFRLEKERQKLLAAGFEPTTKLLAAKLDVAESDVIEVSAHLASREVSLEPRPDEDGIGLADKLPTPGTTPEDQAARTELSDAVRKLMTRFEASLEDERERAIWREHLASSEDPISLAVLGERHGVSKQRMGQIADKLKKRFREQIVSDLGADIQMTWNRSS
jgi:RNA polymerase sigma-32 factor